MSTRKKIILITVSVILVAGIVLGIIFWPQINAFVRNIFQQSVVSEDEPEQGTGPSSSKSQKLYSDALAVAISAGPDAGQKILDNELESSSGPREKADIYSQKSTLAGSVPGGANQTLALEYAYDAEVAGPYYGTAIAIASLEEQAGNKQAAVKYYKLYLERLTDEANQLNPGDKEGYTKRMQKLENELGI